MDIEINSPVRTRDDAHVGQVHRVVVDLEREAVTGIVVLKGHLLSRDILVPLEHVERADENGVTLSLTTDQLEQLPDFAYNEILTPPPTWAFPLPYPGGAVYIPVHQRERLGRNEQDILTGAKVRAKDGEIGEVERVELEGRTGRVDAFWVRPSETFPDGVRIPVEWVADVGEQCIQVAATRAEIESGLGEESRARARA